MLTRGYKFTLNFVLNIVSIPSLGMQEMLQNGEIIASIRFAGKMDRFRRLTSVLSVKRSTTLNITRFPGCGVISKVSRNYTRNLKLLQIRSLRDVIIENVTIALIKCDMIKIVVKSMLYHNYYPNEKCSKWKVNLYFRNIL